MIRMDPLVLLLLMECALVFLVLAVFFFFRARKYKRLCGKAVTSAHVPQEPAPAAMAAAEKAAVEAKYVEAKKEKEQLATTVHGLEAKLQEENKQFEALKKKHELLENEYAILYGKHFEGKEEKKG